MGEGGVTSGMRWGEWCWKGPNLVPNIAILYLMILKSRL